MKKQDTKETKSLKFEYVVVWMRSDIISKVRFNEFILAIEFAQSLIVVSHIYNIDTFEMLMKFQPFKGKI